MASVLPTDIVTRVLNPIVKTGDFPVNQAAVKMMTKVADHAAVRDDNREFILANLHDIMPGLIKVRITCSRGAFESPKMGFESIRIISHLGLESDSLVIKLITDSGYCELKSVFLTTESGQICQLTRIIESPIPESD